jgi:hypothetical protein
LNPGVVKRAEDPTAPPLINPQATPDPINPPGTTAPTVPTGTAARPVIRLPQERLDEMQNPAIETNKDAWNRILQIGLLGLGAGAGTKALLGIRDLFDRPSYAPPKIGPRPAVIEINTPQTQEEIEEQRKLRRKAAADEAALPPRAGRLFDTIETPSGKVDPPVPYIEGLNKTDSQNWWDTLWGAKNVPILSKPFFLPTAIATGMGSIYGGWKGIGAISDWYHSQARKRELEQAKSEYRNALVEQYNADKRAAVSTAHDLSQLAQSMVKESWTWGDVGGAGLGTYLTLAGLLAAGSGMATYNYVKSRVPENRLAKAIKQRERLRWASRPPEIYAVSKPLAAPPQTSPLKDEEAESQDQEEMFERNPPGGSNPIRKLASLYKG